MYKQFKRTLTADEAAGTVDVIVEVGFVPDKVVVRNRTSDYTLEWNDSMASDEYYQFTDGGVQTFEDTGTATFTVIDGSDKDPIGSETSLRSFGVIIKGGVANVTAAQHVLDIYVSREDGV